MKKLIKAAGVVLAIFSSASLALAGSNGGPSSLSPVGTKLGSATLWAVINADGTVARSDGANLNTTFKIVGFNGSYQIGFFRDVTGCTYVATIGNAGAGNPAHGSIVVAARAGVKQAVFVETRNVGATTLEDHPFHLFVNC